MRHICVVTGTRAEYGLLSRLIDEIEQADNLQLQLLVTGTHLSQTHGSTNQEIIADGHHIDASVPILNGGDSPQDVARALATAVSEGAEALTRLEPAVVVILGDRYEVFGIAAACLVLGIPIAHLHGGETTEGAIDESLRNAITKMSALHFVAAEPYRDRVVQMGENPANVHLVGGLGVDVIAGTTLLTRAQLEADLGLELHDPLYLVTFHPETVSGSSGDEQVQPLLQVLAEQHEPTVIFTMPNADAENGAIRQRILEFVRDNPCAHAFDSLGHRRYLSLLPLARAVVGNSSSGLLEAPTFHTPTLNIGARQDGRLRAASVIDVDNTVEAIRRGFDRLQEDDFRDQARAATNPYGDGGASARILAVLRDCPLKGLTQKKFYDLP